MMMDTERLLNTFLDLVRIPSPSGQEEAVAEAIAARLGALGIAVERDEVGNLIACVDGVGEPLLLTAHMDTVVPCEGVEPVVRGEGDARIVASAGDTILGADDKAGVAILLEVLAVLAEKELAHRPLELLFTVGEEKGLRGVQALDVGRLRATMGLGLDVAGVPGIIVVHAPSQDHWLAMVHGRAAHAGGNPEAGISAIQVAAEGIARMPLGRIDDETTANIGVIQGGRATNIIPDRVELYGEARSRDVAKLDKQIRAMSAALEESAAARGATVEIDVRRSYEGYRFSEDAPIVRLLSEAVRSVGIEPLLAPTGGGSDSNVLIARGIDVVQMAIGMQAVHTTDEQIAVADLETTARIVLACVTPLPPEG
jgi:tripeptide aminopeptidase